MADLYRSKVEELASALQREDTPLEASEMLRGLIDSIVLTPEGGQLRIELRGNLAAMLTAAQQTKRSPESGDLIVPVQMVAGACNQLNGVLPDGCIGLHRLEACRGKARPLAALETPL